MRGLRGLAGGGQRRQCRARALVRRRGVPGAATDGCRRREAEGARRMQIAVANIALCEARPRPLATRQVAAPSRASLAGLPRWPIAPCTASSSRRDDDSRARPAAVAESRHAAMSSLAASEPRRPRLAAQNRKLRHLKGISLRNLCFVPAAARRAADDGAVDGGARRLGDLREAGRPLHPSRSSDSLGADKRSPQPSPPRRTSLGWAHASPASRQRRLEDLVESAVGDVFVSLHAGDGHGAPIHVSKVHPRSAVSARGRSAPAWALGGRPRADGPRGHRTSTSSSSTSRPTRRRGPAS